MTFSYERPSNDKFTIYSKSNCMYCLKVKKLLHDYGLVFNEVKCDDYAKTSFFEFIDQIITTKQHRTFPIVFFKGTYIGGYVETVKFLENQNIFDYITIV